MQYSSSPPATLVPAAAGGAPRSAAGAPDIKIADLSVAFGTPQGKVTALQNVNVDIPPGSFFTIVGPSGCGKTTLLKVLSGVLPPSGGTVSFNGKPVERSSFTGQVGYVFQRPLLLPWRTAIENVMLTLEIARPELSRRERISEAMRWLHITGLKGFEHRYPSELSGGMQQRVSISRGLAFQPKVLLMDEPFAALDEITRERLQEELVSLWEKVRISVVFITHSIPEALLLSQRIVVMSGRPGHVVEQIDIDFPRPRNEDTRQEPRFIELQGHIRHLLRENPHSASATTH
ncbi:ABC transporter ATP-binding protein [Variovorax sp. J22P271]|uniref:ABC transporter ATP-binding protein n=1 Tax=Variovorax davisae TaxID=3053515 RepID=UPI002575E0BA|nr:ABC transporter ATP-binding protein [Variovorax sp. J22P271]MDM0035936.1 ABC transporter ATP-binding protein [Variovorax sp. J22P271]